jgi:hypothetical protein
MVPFQKETLVLHTKGLICNGMVHTVYLLPELKRRIVDAYCTYGRRRRPMAGAEGNFLNLHARHVTIPTRTEISRWSY